MTLLELMERLTGIGASMSADGDQVAVYFPEERRVDVEALGLEIRRLKPELLRVIAEPSMKPVTAGPESPLHGLIGGQLVTMTPAPAECPALPQGVRLVKYAPKDPPVAIAPISIVTEVDKFIRAYLRDLGHRLKYPETHACAPLSEILAKLAEVGLEVTLDGSTERTRESRKAD